MKEIEDIFDNTNQWLRFAEAKNAVLVTVCGVAIWAALRLILSPEISGFAQIFLAQLLFFAVAGTSIGLVSFLPITSYSFLMPLGDTAEADNLVFYGHLAKYRKSELRKKILKAAAKKESEFLPLSDMYLEQIIVNSRIALAKFKFFEFGASAMLLGILTPILGLPILLLANRRRKIVDGI